jgi:glyoxylase-like metal-dependent hydrolase (beta-lactamase superfamily II)
LEEAVRSDAKSFSRRNLLIRASALGAACAAAPWLPGPALAESAVADKRATAGPVADKGFASVHKIGEGVYATISDRTKGLQTRSNGGFIIGRDAALLVEGFQTPIGAAFQVEVYKMVSKVPIRAAINTHFHFDHSLGNSYYGGLGLPIWAHAKAASRMTERYPQWQTESLQTFLAPWQKRVLEAKTDLEREHAKSDIEGLTGMFEPVSQAVLALPNHPLDPAKMPTTIDLGGRSVIIEHYIGHTDTDLIFRVPDQNIVFTGDLLVDSQYPTNIDGIPAPWRATLAKFAAFDKDTIFVPGHGQVCGLDRVALMRSVLDDIADQAQGMFKRGVPVQEAADRYVVPEKWKNFRMFSWGFCVGRTIEQLYAEWGKPGRILNYYSSAPLHTS